jgi:uncharacterized protein
MTPEERQMVRDLFDRLAQLEREPRDADAERAIREGLARAPNAVYALVQTVLLQDEGLRAADARIAELEDALARAEPPQSSGSFLGDRRAGGGSKWNTGTVLGGGAAVPAGSVPSVGGRGEPMGVPPGYGGERGDPYAEPPGGGRGGPWQGGGPGGPYQGSPGGGMPGGGGGGGFLGTAAAIAAGAIGGGLLMGGIRSALGGHGDSKGPMQGALDQLGGRSGAGSAAGGNLSSEAGLDDIGRSRLGARRDEPKKEEAEEEDDQYEEEEEEEDSDLDHDEMHDSYDDDQQ